MIVNRFVQDKDTICRRIDDEVVVIQGDGHTMHVLNKTAALIWEMCDSKLEIDEIAMQLCERFDVSIEDANADVSEVIDKFIQAGIMNEIKEEQEGD